MGAGRVGGGKATHFACLHPRGGWSGPQALAIPHPRPCLALLAGGRIAIAGTKGGGLQGAQMDRYDPGEAAEELPPAFSASARSDGLWARCLAGELVVCREGAASPPQMPDRP